MVPWLKRPTIAVDLDVAVGRRFDHVPPDALAAGRQLLGAVVGQLPPETRDLAHLVRLRTHGRFHAEAVSLAERIGVDWRDVVLANVSYDLVLSSLGCSTVVLPTPAGPVIARNMDWWPEGPLARASYVVESHRAGALAYAQAGWPGAVGVVSGLSARGFAVVLNAVMGPEGFNRSGYPVLLHLRRVLEDADHFDAALAILSEEPLTVSALFTLAGRENHQRVVIERTPTRYAHRRAEGYAPLVATNDYRLLSRPQASQGSEIYRTTCTRYDALLRFFARHQMDQEVGDNALLYVLSDPEVIQGITAQHVILRPRTGETSLYVPRRLMNPEPGR
jgi:hypothetical protein